MVFVVERIETFRGRFFVEAASPGEAVKRFDDAMENDEWFSERVCQKTDQAVDVDRRLVSDEPVSVDPRWIDLPLGE